MGPSVENYFHEFTREIGKTDGARALELNSSLSLANVQDITYAEAGRWVVDEMSEIDLSNEAEIRARIDVANELLLDLKACAIWPIAAHAHMQIVHQLKHLIPEDDAMSGDRDMSYTEATKWADEEVIKIDLQDPFAVAERIAIAAEKLRSEENCRTWPVSAHAHRMVLTGLTYFLRKNRGTLH